MINLQKKVKLLYLLLLFLSFYIKHVHVHKKLKS